MPSHTKSERKIHKVMGEFKRGTLHHGGSGKVVKRRKVAVAIAMSEARRVARTSTMGSLHGSSHKREKRKKHV